jgi:polysaccharide pyruvyl transferase WcaK-like protein
MAAPVVTPPRAPDARSASRRGRSALRVARSTARTLGVLRLLPPSPRTVGYLGYVGAGNAGDELIYAVHAEALPRARFVPLPTNDTGIRLLERIAAVRPNAVERGLLLGGGTLIGRPGWASAVAAAVGAWPRAPLAMLGAGVEDPEFSDRAAAELERWKELLPRFDRITVRGPRSAEILASLGVESEVVGDPTLYFADERPSGRVEDNLLGLNVAAPHPMWGSEPEAVQSALVGLARHYVARGWRVLVLPFWERDLPYVDDLVARVGAGAEVFPDWRSLPRLTEATRACRVFVGVRLHAVVLASLVYVPSVGVEYHPKLGDFQRSIGREAYTVRTDAVSTDALVELTETLAAERDDHVAALHRDVRRRQAQVVAELDRLRALFGEAAAEPA